MIRKEALEIRLRRGNQKENNIYIVYRQDNTHKLCSNKWEVVNESLVIKIGSRDIGNLL